VQVAAVRWFSSQRLCPSLLLFLLPGVRVAVSIDSTRVFRGIGVSDAVVLLPVGMRIAIRRLFFVCFWVLVLWLSL